MGGAPNFHLELTKEQSWQLREKRNLALTSTFDWVQDKAIEVPDRVTFELRDPETGKGFPSD